MSVQIRGTKVGILNTLSSTVAENAVTFIIEEASFTGISSTATSEPLSLK